MKRVLQSVFALVAILLLCILAGALPVRVRAGGGPVAVQNGDVNGDGAMDISDPVYMLQFLFRGGPAPTACAGSSSVDDRLAALETTVTDLTHRLDCALAAPQALPGRFTDNGDGTVTDSCTGLMWQKSTGDVNEDGIVDERDAIVFDTARLYVRGIGLGGHHDWRLPTIRDLESLIDRTRVNPAIDPIFEDTRSVLANRVPEVAGYYMSSDFACVGCEPNGAILALDFGGAGSIALWNCCGFRVYVRAVRTP